MHGHYKPPRCLQARDKHLAHVSHEQRVINICIRLDFREVQTLWWQWIEDIRMTIENAAYLWERGLVDVPSWNTTYAGRTPVVRGCGTLPGRPAPLYI